MSNSEYAEGQARVIAAVNAERQRQDNKWGIQNHGPEHWYVILGEEVGEVARAIYEGDLAQASKELIEVAAVAVAFVQSLERNQGVKVQGDGVMPAEYKAQGVRVQIGFDVAADHAKYRKQETYYLPEPLREGQTITLSNGEMYTVKWTGVELYGPLPTYYARLQ